MQGFFADASRQQNLRHVVFGEVDGADPVTSVSVLLSKRLFSDKGNACAPQSVTLQTVAAEREVTTFPTVEAWKQGKCVAVRVAVLSESAVAEWASAA